MLGATGFLGQHVVAALGERALAHSRAEERAGSPLLRAELSDLAQLGELLEVAGARALINCAAVSSPLDCERDPTTASLLNVELPRALGEWAQEQGGRVVHVSTDLVFGADPAPLGGFREEDEPAPLSTYGETKAGGERAVLRACPGASVVRLPLLYGDSHGLERGASDGLFAALGRGERARLIKDEWRTPLPVSVAAEALVEPLLGIPFGSTGTVRVPGE